MQPKVPQSSARVGIEILLRFCRVCEGAIYIYKSEIGVLLYASDMCRLTKRGLHVISDITSGPFLTYGGLERPLGGI